MEKKSIKEMTVRDVLLLPEFTKYMKEVIDSEIFDHRKAQTEAIAKGMRLQRTALDSLRERDLLDAEKLVDVYGAILNKSLIGFSSAERAYISLVGNEAFKRTMYRLKDMEEKEKEK